MKNYTQILAKRMVVLALLAFAFAMNAQNRIHISTNSIKPQGGRVVVDFDIVLDGYEMGADEQVVLTPLVSDRKGNALSLPAVVVNGKRRDNVYRRQLFLDAKRGIAPPDTFGVIRARGRVMSERIGYSLKIDRKAWMNEAYVSVRADLCGCGSAREGLPEMEVGQLVRPDKPQFVFGLKPHIAFVQPRVEPVKRRVEEKHAYIIFPAGKTEIDAQVEHNRAELAAISQSFRNLEDEVNAEITAVRIEAYSSPEGQWNVNLRLSEQRARALKDYVRNRYGVSSGIIYSEGKGENWSDLYNLIEADMQIGSKEQVLQIVREVGIFEGRELKLMQLDGGRPYRYMLENLFPQLRRTNQLIRIEYTAPAFTVERAKELLATNPQALSVEEYYRMANSYPQGSEAQNDLFVQAARQFPADITANLNAAAAYLAAGNAEEAAEILEQYEELPAAWNNLGVLRMMQRRADEAEAYLTRARARGLAEAEGNLALMPKLRADIAAYEQARQEYEEYLNTD